MKKSLFIFLVVIVVLGFISYAVINGLRQVGDNQGYQPAQPIAFSHKVHAGANQISCLYCHYGAEKGRHAGVPADSVCMNCHTNIKKDSPEIAKIKKALDDKKPIEWLKVHRMADFVYFNHQRHVVDGKVSCQTCHGSVESMVVMRQESPLTMGWCLDCHRKSEVVVHGSNQKALVSDVGGTDCARCHY